MAINKYCFNRDTVDGIKGLCERMTGRSLQSPYRSTVPLLSLIEFGWTEWKSLMETLGAPVEGPIYFEFCVSSPKPGANPSQTDALLLSDSAAWAFEAKWSEPRYETVAQRVCKPESDGADPRTTVNGWLKHIEPFASHELRLDDFLGVVYQEIHRTASACAVAKERGVRPEVVYLHFHPSPLASTATTEQYVSDLRKLHELLGNPSTLRFTVVEMPLQTTATFESIKNLDKRAKESAAKVKAALCSGPLFNFGEPKIVRI